METNKQAIQRLEALRELDHIHNVARGYKTLLLKHNILSSVLPEVEEAETVIAYVRRQREKLSPSPTLPDHEAR